MSYISVRHAHKEFINNGAPLTILEDINLDIERGEFICLLGPSGSGKSTLLNAMAGFELISSGSITIDGEPVKAPQLRYVTVFQNYGLLPWRTVESNIALGLESKGVPKSERAAIVDKYVTMVGLGHARHRYPAELSGGMQQRVSIARALAVDPDIIFMDEPLGALDALTRIHLQDEISRICREEGKTVIFVTHDIEEAVVLADRIVLLSANPGRVQTIIPVNIIDRTDRTSASFVNIRNHIFEQFQLAREDKIEFYI
ncbi:ABC transporter ATP-binding protein [Veillonella agrestimuris]|uniref:ABC transporter ATP-binding protein n=1 Tax=Veillonella agrestimuris TaxID=2941340 RepID=UPI00203C61DE|nr:ABC transporter ATP-binding protein [Veillonella agrestimuris]